MPIRFGVVYTVSTEQELKARNSVRMNHLTELLRTVIRLDNGNHGRILWYTVRERCDVLNVGLSAGAQFHKREGFQRRP